MVIYVRDKDTVHQCIYILTFLFLLFSLTDCAGIPFGNAQLGACGCNDNWSCRDCFGVVNGTAQLGLCGCEDNSTCVDCLGIPYGPAQPLACGCNDDTSCKDCQGTINGTATEQWCGKCGTDASECNTILGATLGTFLGLVLICGLAFWLFTRRRRRDTRGGPPILPGPDRLDYNPAAQPLLNRAGDDRLHHRNPTQQPENQYTNGRTIYDTLREQKSRAAGGGVPNWFGEPGRGSKKSV